MQASSAPDPTPSMSHPSAAVSLATRAERDINARSGAPYRIVIRPNGALSSRAAAGFVVAVALPLLSAAGWLALRGMWPMLVIAVFQLGAVWIALQCSRRDSRYREVLTFDRHRMAIEHGRLAVGCEQRWSLPICWVRVALCKAPHCNAPLELYAMAQGRRIRIAQCLTDAERMALAFRLKTLLAHFRRLDHLERSSPRPSADPTPAIH